MLFAGRRGGHTLEDRALTDVEWLEFKQGALLSRLQEANRKTGPRHEAPGSSRQARHRRRRPTVSYGRVRGAGARLQSDSTPPPSPSLGSASSSDRFILSSQNNSLASAALLGQAPKYIDSLRLRTDSITQRASHQHLPAAHPSSPESCVLLPPRAEGTWQANTPSSVGEGEWATNSPTTLLLC